jgi:hypothetical protein
MIVGSLFLQLSVYACPPELHHRSLRLPAGVREIRFGSRKARCARLRWRAVAPQVLLQVSVKRLPIQTS